MNLQNVNHYAENSESKIKLGGIGGENNWKIWVSLASKMHDNVIPFATRNFRKFSQM